MGKKIFPAKLEYLEEALIFITDEAKAAGLDDKKVGQIKLASEEAVVNIINYAYPDKDGNFEIACIPNPKESKGLEMEIVDWGIPFNPLELPEPDINVPMEERKIGGLGIFMVRKIMDEVNYKRQEERNILTLVKY